MAAGFQAVTELAVAFFTAASVLFGLNWWETKRRPSESPKRLPP